MDLFLGEYLSIAVFFAIAIGLSLAFVLTAFVFGNQRPDSEKMTAYECGFDVTQDPIAIRDIMMLMESVSSLLNRIKGERTAFHDVTDGVFTWDERKCEEVLQDFLQDTEIFT